MKAKKYKSPRRLKTKPPKVIAHNKTYNRKKLKLTDKSKQEILDYLKEHANDKA